jgi:hypothetical protein
MQIRAVRTKIRSMPLDTWYNVAQIIGVVLVAITFIVAAATFGIGYFVNKKKDAQALQQEERIAELTLKAEVLNAEAENAKKERAQADLKIEEARERAAKADERAAAAEERAGEANKEAGKANLRAGELELQAQQLARQNLELRSGVANLETAAAEARAKQAEAELALAELEKDALPRMLGFTTDPAAPNSIAPLQAFPGKKVIVEVVDNEEAREAAGQLISMLKFAGWDIVDVRPETAGYSSLGGVFILEDSREFLWRPPRSDRAISELVRILEVNKWDVRRHGSEALTQPGVTTIGIGKKPLSRYLFEKRFPEAKKDREEFEKLEKRSREQTEEMLRELRKGQKP